MSTETLPDVVTRPILFSGQMVRAILDERKTHTRRIAKDFILHDVNADYVCQITNDSTFIGWWSTAFKSKQDAQKATDKHYQIGSGVKCPYGKVGDRLWVRETFSAELGKSLHPKQPFAYKADWCNGDVTGWTPSIHMPRKASRITLDITGIRVERLNDISEDDCLSEGIEQQKPLTNWVKFAALWESINGIGSWKQNAWVWVVEFKKL